MTGRVAAVDCGTNTIKFLIADFDPATGEVVEIVRESRMVRLGQGVDETGRLADEALARAFAALDGFAVHLRNHPVRSIRFCATSATRDAANAEDFARGVHRRLGVTPEVLTGDEEAAIAYAAAVRSLHTPPTGPVLVIDIGGGSTELVLGGPDEEPHGHSMDVGSVRLYERHVRSDPPEAEELAAAADDVRRALAACPVDPAAATQVVGMAGTICTVAAGVLDLPEYDRARIDQQVLDAAAVHALSERYRTMTVAERRALPYMHPGRADVIVTGALVLDEVLRASGATELTVTEAGILDGIAWSQAAS